MKSLKNFIRFKQFVAYVLGANEFPCNIIYQGILKTLECSIIVKRISKRVDGSKIFYKCATTSRYRRFKKFGFWMFYYKIMYKLVFGLDLSLSDSPTHSRATNKAFFRFSTGIIIRSKGNSTFS